MKSPNHFLRFAPLAIVLAFLAITLAASSFNKSQPTEFEFEAEQAEQEKGEAPGADAWFHEQRAYPLNEIPHGARMRAIEQMEEAELRQRELRRASFGNAAEAIELSQPKWEALGPQPITNGNTGTVSRPAAGRTTAVAFDPGYDGVNNRTVYLGAAQGGVWRTRDNGATWTPLLDDQASLAVGSLAIDPNNPNIIYVGTGEGNSSGDSYYGAGLLKSVDGGVTWRLIAGPVSTTAPQVPAFDHAALMHIAIDPTNTQTIYLCTRSASNSGPSGGGGTAPVTPGQRGVWKSTDGGETWRNLNVTADNGITNANDLLIHPQDSNTLFAGIPGRGIYRSTTGGAAGSWTLLTQGLPSSDIGRIKLEVGPPIAPSTLPTLVAAIATGGSLLHGVYRSTDNGATWTRTTGQPASVGQTSYNLTLSVDPLNANIIYLGMVTFYRTIDGGATWINQANGNGNGQGGLHSDQHFSVVHRAKPNIFFIANDGGIWRSDNANVTTEAMGWTNLNQTLNTVQFQAVAMHPTNPNYLIGGTQDNGTNRFTGSAGWMRVAGGDGGFSLVDQSTPTTVWHSFQNSSSTTAPATSDFGPRVSFNAGDTWTDRGCRGCTATPGNMNSTDRVGFYSPMALSTGFAQPANVIYWGTHRLYRSADIGVTWTGLGASTDGFGQDLSKGGTGRLSTIAPHPKLDNSTNPAGEIVWAGTSDGNVQVTTNAGSVAAATFTNVTKAPLPNRFVTDIAVDPNDRNRAYAVYAGFNVGTPTTPGHVFMTKDLGQTWQNISGDLPDVPVTSLAVDPAEGTLYIGSDIGVFQTTDGGATWVRLGNGMPRVASYMVRYHAASRSIVVATHGRGMYRLKLALPATTVSAASFSRAALAVESIAAAFGQNFATRVDVAPSVPLPTQLAGTTVTLLDSAGVERLAPLFFVSPQQVNYLIPAETAPGGVSVTITSGDGTGSFGVENIRRVAPSIFAANANGRGVPAGVAIRVRGGVQTSFPIARAEGGQFVPEPIDLGPAGDQVVLVLFGGGVRRANLPAVKVTVGGVELQPDYANIAPGFVGLDQINVLLPRALAGRGELDVVVRADGQIANAVRIAIK